MSGKVEVEFFLAMDEDKNWYVAKTADDVIADLSGDGGVCMRTVKLTVKMAPPKYDEIGLDVPDTTHIEAEADAIEATAAE